MTNICPPPPPPRPRPTPPMPWQAGQSAADKAEKPQQKVEPPTESASPPAKLPEHWWCKGRGMGSGAGFGEAQRKFKNGDELWAAFLRYVEDSQANPLLEEKVFNGKDGIARTSINKMRPLTQKAFRLHAGFTRYAWALWRKEREDLHEAMDDIEDAVFTQKFEGAAAGLLSTNLISRDLGLEDRQRMTFDGEGETIEVEVFDTTNVAELYHPDDIECLGPLYTLAQLEAGIQWVPPMKDITP